MCTQTLGLTQAAGAAIASGCKNYVLVGWFLLGVIALAHCMLAFLLSLGVEDLTFDVQSKELLHRPEKVSFILVDLPLAACFCHSVWSALIHLSVHEATHMQD